MADILTPFSLWNDFNLTLPLKESKINVVSLGMVDYNYIYFSGRQTDKGRVRIYGLYAKQKANSKGSILILPDCDSSIDEEFVLYFVKQGYDVLFIDYCGEREGVKNFTKYPSDISYANYHSSGRTFYFADKTAKETCWYEWTAVARYALNFLQENNPNKKISAIGIKYGANVLWQLAGIDKRISSAIFLFGAGWLAYKDVDKRSDAEIEMNDERFRFLAAVDAQAYAQYVECPVLFLGSTNNAEFNPERAVDTLSRINNQKNVNFNFIPSSIEVLDDECLKNVDIFLKKHLANEKLRLPEQPQLEVEFNDGVINYNINYSNKSDVENVKLLTSFNDSDHLFRVWYDVLPIGADKNGKNVYKLKPKNSLKSILTYVIVRYKNGYTVSSRFVYKKIDLKIDAKIPNILFNADNNLIEFLATDIKSPLICDVFTTENLYKLIEGPNGIKGLSTVNAITTYSIRSLANNFSENSFIKFDVYASEFTSLDVVLSDGNNDYSYVVNVTGGEVWQNVMTEFSDFKNDKGLPIEDFTKIISVTFKSIGKFAINNILVL